ncbi:aminoglycoside phosphotransferase family protein [Aeromonas veronii]|uniref:aminoglycoside phosphotransferase family protein n=1 Tax=Aeromonas veronii TaxID=654 RepID=UPI0021D9AD44|nr:aminoglycoside phosphotransferase family protein [Aeromonas veronii]UYB71016.1 aminoglycoside phosphotransferase family protein [Aeromonas veronii]
MFLIMSAAYVNQDLEAEFGKIPPSFLPLGNRRLFKHQVALAPSGTDIYLSVPEGYRLSDSDLAWLTEQGVKVIYIPVGLSLGASLVAAVNLSEYRQGSSLHVLYGDTLFGRLPTGENIVSVSKTEYYYNWATLEHENIDCIEDENRDVEGLIIDGYFKFQDARELIRCITQCNWSFLEGLNRYHHKVRLNVVKSDGWLDFGHVNTYYRSKAEFTTQRAFNEIVITPYFIEKSSVHNVKIMAEAEWFENLPFSLRGYIPQFLGSSKNDGSATYRLEYLHNTALNEVYVFSALPSFCWKPIINNCLGFLLDCQRVKNTEKQPANQVSELFGAKTLSRINDYCQSTNISINEHWKYNGFQPVSIQDLLDACSVYLPKDCGLASVLHGDFCFSNILYDFRAQKIKVIDPRGITANSEMTIYGDVSYDIAKLSHSILGLYDWIIAGYYDVNISAREIEFKIKVSNYVDDIQSYYISRVGSVFGMRPETLYAMQIHLFLSMLPLHADCKKRQNALFANAFRLFHILKGLN